MLLVRSLTNSGRYALVTGEGVGPQPDFVLLTDLQAFQAEVVSGQVSVVITTSMTLMRDSDGRVVSSRSFTNSAQVPDSSAERITAAFDAAMTQQLKSIAAWLAGNAGV
jgi:cholesterol transport system auxiliary component